MAESMDWNERYVSGQTPWDSGEVSKELQCVLAERSIPRGRALEIGCGTGTNAVWLAKQGFQVTAFDLSPVAIEKAKGKAKGAGATVDFRVADALNLPEAGKFPFVFDRGVYHVLRRVNLFAFLKTLERITDPGSLYLTLAGNANEPSKGEGPPIVHGHEICFELLPLFDVVQLREFRFDGVVIEGKHVQPLAWSALSRRKSPPSA